MDFNLDDPLGDILSEGSNDSFFDVGAKGKGSQPKHSTPKPAKSAGKFEDLFGIKDSSIIPSQPKESKPVEQVPSKRIEAPKKPQAPPPKSTMSFNDDDLISDLGFDPKKPKSAKSSNILDDILGPMESKKPSTAGLSAPRPHTSGGILKDESKVISRQSTETTESTVAGTSVPSISRPKTSAGPRQSLVSSNDPLGLFGPSAKETSIVRESRETPKPARRKGTTADWLGLEPETKPEKDAPVVEERKEASRPPQVLTIHDNQANIPQTITPVQPTLSAFNPASNAVLLTASNLDSQNALQALQQQEAQVMLATQMKNQEVALMEMQHRQQHLLTQQESQFNSLVQKQLTRQSQLEATIRAQQDRINAHIQMLMSQPPPLLASVSDNNEEPIVGARAKETDSQLEEVILQAEVKRLDLEKLRLEDLLSNVHANHEKEIEFMESSHRKQIQVLEENYQNAENRLKDEIKNIDEHYHKKVDVLEIEKKDLIVNYETKLKDISTENDEALKRLKENYRIEVDTLRSEHKTMIDNIRQSKLFEFAVMQENTSYLQTLKSASNNLENVSGDLQTLRNELYSRIDTAHKEKESKLEARERVVEDKERQLKIIEETAEQERNRLMTLVATLESQLTKLSKETSEEQWALRQKLSTLEVERSSFEREKQFSKEQLQRDEKRIEDLKQYQLEEHQRLMQQIQDEKQLIAVEKARLETAKKLQANTNTEQLKTESEAALKVAQDAARQADQERERYLAMQRQLEALKRELVDEESAGRQKQDELDSLIYSAKSKERSMQDAVQRTRQAEQHFNAKVQMLQVQIRQNSQREAQLSQDRVELSRQRFELQEIRKRLQQTKCSLCRIGEKSTELAQILARDNADGMPGNVLPPAQLTYGFSGYHPQSDIDRLFDDDMVECLRRMQTRDSGVSATIADLDYTTTSQRPQRDSERVKRTYTVPTQTLDSELLEASVDIQKILRE